MFVKVEPSGCCERKGLVQIRFAMYLEQGDYSYDKQYVQVPVIPNGGYKGKVDDSGSPVNTRHYQEWLNSLPKVWQLNPFHNHFIYVEPETTDEEIKAQMAFHLPNFYEAWRQGWGEVKGGMRHGWDVKTRIRPKRYDKLESPEEYLIRKTRCQARVISIQSFLAQIATTEKGETFPASAIDIGPGATDRAGGAGAYANFTVLDLANPANATGTIDTFELWFTYNGTGIKVGTLENTSGTNFDDRDYETVGAVTAGSKQTFSGLDCDVVTGDYAGVYVDASGGIEWDTTGGSGNHRLAGDQWGAGDQNYGALQADRAISVYGTGVAPTAQAVGSGSVAIAGTLTKMTSKYIGSGAIAIAGALVAIRVYLQSVGDGAVSIAGNVVGELVAFAQAVGGGSIAIAGALTKYTQVNVGGGAVSIAGSMARKILQSVGNGIVVTHGTLTRQIYKNVGQGSVAIAGTIIKGVFVGQGAVSIAGSLVTDHIVPTLGRALKIVVVTTQFRTINVITTMYRKIKTITTGGQ